MLTYCIWHNLECLKFCFKALLEGICATFNLCIQAKMLYIHYYINIYLKDVIFVQSLEAQIKRKLTAC